MRSMTGFGLGEVRVEGGRITIELRSVNHRYSDVRVRVPPELADLTFYIEQLGRRLLGRGRFDLSVRIEGGVIAPASLVPKKLRSLYQSLSQIREELSSESPIDITALLGAPGVFSSTSPAQDVPLQQAIDLAFTGAVESLNEMRKSEGLNLATQLREHVETAQKLVDACRERAALVVPTLRQKLHERVVRLATATSKLLDDVRLEQEVVLLAERSDVTEEVSRIISHFGQFATLLESNEPVGRRLDFLLQEISRESNTLGAKSQDAGLSHLVVELKAEVEKMREQVQNVE